MTNDQEHYGKLMAQLDEFIAALEEWEDQCDPESNESENAALRMAISDATRCLNNLGRAKVLLNEYEKQQKEGLLIRIQTGTTRFSDAQIARKFML